MGDTEHLIDDEYRQYRTLFDISRHWFCESKIQ